jgi:hypothetical protein
VVAHNIGTSGIGWVVIRHARIETIFKLLCLYAHTYLLRVAVEKALRSPIVGVPKNAYI